MSFPELAFLETLLERLKGRARVERIETVKFRTESFPLYSVVLGSEDPAAPCFAVVGGVHGQEKIGSQVALSFLETLSQLAEWDEITNIALRKSRVAFFPIVNPVGMYLLRRGNGNHVDLNRNAPVEASSHSYPLLGGQRFSPHIPWYRGREGAAMEKEAQAYCDFVRKHVFPSRSSILLDCHSGYGSVDRLWFPFSHTFKPFPSIAEAYALKTLLDATHPNHVYVMEPAAQGYTTSGDLTDYVYLEHHKQSGGEKIFLPITLEMGSWLWLKKNPVQLFSAMGLFHPIHIHRHQRILRRHIPLFDFLHRAVINPEQWAFFGKDEREDAEEDAIEFWYPEE